ncbi:hypothetical protein D3C76_1403130 [compost metagenome]
MVAVRGTGRDPGGDGAGFVQAFLHDLTVPGLFVVAQLTSILGRIQLADVGVDTDLAKQAFHAEGP